jgi:hypothetical protein
VFRFKVSGHTRGRDEEGHENERGRISVMREYREGPSLQEATEGRIEGQKNLFLPCLGFPWKMKRSMRLTADVSVKRTRRSCAATIGKGGQPFHFQQGQSMPDHDTGPGQ